MKIGDIIEHKNKESESGYSHDGKYKITCCCRMKDPTTRKWVDAFMYANVHTLELFVREKTDFENKFKIVENGSKD